MNFRLRPVLGLLLVPAYIAGCDSVVQDADVDLLVVEAFLYAGEPVENVKISRAISLTSTDTVAVPVNGASVSLVRNDRTFTLSQVGLEGRYAYLGEDLNIKSGDVFELSIVADGQSATAVTEVPPPPENVVLSGEILEVPSFGGGPPQINNNYLTVTWDNAEESLHYVVIESTVTGEPTYILPEFVRDRVARFSLTTRPTEANYFDINVRSLEVLGPHEVRVYRINEEYAELYENRQQDSRDLNAPPTNVQGGLGVFSAFNSRTLSFEVVTGE